ncbi:hypothetical protein [Bradyrhizobium sp. AUGA SZCCT0160]|nr:hypothetical protein [Bradyrhizobium sp. AUGA SZCCT0160]MBR1189414.1 hypothetical protein [Bradyrhizobium sp. AUGA SZCCT0160]
MRMLINVAAARSVSTRCAAIVTAPASTRREAIHADSTLPGTPAIWR